MPHRSLLQRLRGRFHVRRKNAGINANIRDFIARNAGRSFEPREAELCAEVVIPCYNHGRFLEAALGSIPSGVDVTVVDDASTDDTEAIIRRLRGRFRFKTLRNDRNLLQTGSLNRAVAESTNNMFVVLNADDCLLPYSVDTVLALFRAHPGLRLVGGGAIAFADDSSLRLLGALPSRLGYVPTPRVYTVEQARHYRRLNDINMSMSGSAFLRSAWSAVGGYVDFASRVCSYDDRDFQMRVSCLFEVGVIDEPLCLYRVVSSLGRAEFTG